LAKILAFFAQSTASFCKYLIITLGFEKNAHFFPSENWQKSPKIVIVTSTPFCDQVPPTLLEKASPEERDKIQKIAFEHERLRQVSLHAISFKLIKKMDESCVSNFHHCGQHIR
jgi:hypothetical protein